MAFPLETSHLLAHLRSTYLSLTDTDDYAKRIIKTITVPSEDATELHIPRVQLSSSPPIMFHIAEQVDKSIQGSHSRQEHHKTANHRRRRKPPADLIGLNMEEDSEGEDEGRSNRKADGISPGNSISPEINATMERPHTHEANWNTPSSEKNGHGLLYTKTIRGKRSSKTGLGKFFQSNRDSNSSKKSNELSSDSDSGGSINTQLLSPGKDRHLGYIKEELSESNSDGEITDDGDITETEAKAKVKIRKIKKSNSSDAVTVDSDLGIAVDADADVSMEQDSMALITDEEDDDEDEDYEYVEEDDEAFSDEFDDEEDVDDMSSTDSAFTDIETDSILDSSMLLDSYGDSATHMYSFANHNSNISGFTSKKDRKKKRRMSFDNQSLSRTANFKGTAAQNSVFSSTNKANGGGKPSGNKKQSMNFEKVDLSVPSIPKESNLSSLIQTKSKSTNVNPLNYYAFGDYKVITPGAKKTTLNVFLPPSNKPVIQELSINDNISIADCIGFILLNLYKLPEFKDNLNDPTLLNPNHWRLELVDEDGENYGPFGILDRTRLLSSYNNPKELALCKELSKHEIMKNERNTPLALEFRQSLEDFQKRRKSIDDIIEDDTKLQSSEPKIELKILHHTSHITSVSDYNIFYTVPSESLGSVLRRFCVQQGLSPMKYRFRLLEETVNNAKKPKNPLVSFQGNLESTKADSENRFLSESEVIASLHSYMLEIVPVTNKVNSMLESNENNLSINTITPSDSTFTMHITPEKRQLEEKMQSLALDSNEPSDAKTHVSVQGAKSTALATAKTDSMANTYLDDIMTGKNPQLPANLNTIYFKWKVWRKKTTILNKIEKSLIIDGDYIHLTQSDDIFFKKNALDNPFPTQSEGQSHHHHHHHLYYYNYNNYYKESMMKTSSFHITQIVKLKQYKNSKNPNHFKIVIQKQLDSTANSKEAVVKKKYDLEAATVEESQEIIDKLKWVLQVYNLSSLNSQ
ncbi:uncharacterized protein RJT20DRAFT_119242 [Scheffersomyces xylosifermentans]|uniref:uncharacterized protein n=1 Tax=Scheffersomyces xylosifermentans TaxID=1304137 RepID=UPI00315CD6CF